MRKAPEVACVRMSDLGGSKQRPKSVFKRVVKDSPALRSSEGILNSPVFGGDAFGSTKNMPRYAA